MRRPSIVVKRHRPIFFLPSRAKDVLHDDAAGQQVPLVVPHAQSMIPTLRAAAVHVRPRLSHMVRPVRTNNVPLAYVRPWDVYTMVQVAYFALVYNTTPHPLHVMSSLAQAYISTNQMELASFLLKEMTMAPSEGICHPSHPMLCDALASHIHLLHMRAAHSTDYDPDMNREDHPAYTLATLYDACAAAQILLPCTALSALISRLSKHLHGTTLAKLIRVVASDFMERPPTDYTSSVISAIVIAYGRASVPHEGDAFVRDYATRHGGTCTTRLLASQHRPQHLSWLRQFTSARHIPIDAPLHNAWSSHTDVWNAIIRAHVLHGDTVGARIWLERFRITKELAPMLRDLGLQAPHMTSSPYHTFVHGVSTFRGIRSYSAKVSPAEQLRHEQQAQRLDVSFKAAVVYDVIDSMRRDGVVMGVSLLNFLANFEGGHAHIQRGISLAIEALSLERGPANVAQRVRWPSTASESMRGRRMHLATVTALCTLYAADARQHMSLTSLMPFDGKPFEAIQDVDIATLRGVLSHCVELVTKFPSQKHLAKNGLALLNAMLRAMLWTNDFPGAWYTTQLFVKWHIQPDMYTYLALWQRFSPVMSELSAPKTLDAVQELLLHMVGEQVKALGTVALDEPAWAAALCQDPKVEGALSRIKRDAHARL